MFDLFICLILMMQKCTQKTIQSCNIYYIESKSSVFRFQVSVFKLFIIHYSLFIIHYSLFIIHYSWHRRFDTKPLLSRISSLCLHFRFLLSDLCFVRERSTRAHEHSNTRAFEHTSTRAFEHIFFQIFTPFPFPLSPFPFPLVPAPHQKRSNSHNFPLPEQILPVF